MRGVDWVDGLDGITGNEWITGSYLIMSNDLKKVVSIGDQLFDLPFGFGHFRINQAPGSAPFFLLKDRIVLNRTSTVILRGYPSEFTRVFRNIGNCKILRDTGSVLHDDSAGGVDRIHFIFDSSNVASLMFTAHSWNENGRFSSRALSANSHFLFEVTLVFLPGEGRHWRATEWHTDAQFLSSNESDIFSRDFVPRGGVGVFGFNLGRGLRGIGHTSDVVGNNAEFIFATLTEIGNVTFCLVTLSGGTTGPFFGSVGQNHVSFNVIA